MWHTLFSLHDFLADLVTKYFLVLKKGLLVFAHLMLLGFLFPEVRREYGVAAGNLLIFILFLSPLARITKMRLVNLLLGMRREIGILMAYLALVHGLGFMFDQQITAAFATMPPPVAWPLGVLALFLTLPLLLTSNNFAQKKLGGKNWKRLHRVVYAVFALAILHRYFWQGDTFALLQAAFLASVYVGIKVYAWRPFWQWPEKVMQNIGERYRAYGLEKKEKIGYTQRV
jgi:DMSO/TMAO reductase YedYZ heme-binding membrane subunit